MIDTPVGVRPTADSNQLRPTRRAIVRGAAWTVPIVVAAGAAPTVSASCSPVRQIVFQDMNVQTPSGAAPANLLRYTYGNTTGGGGIGQIKTDPATGLSWAVNTFLETITNTSAYTITDIAMPVPFMAVAYTDQTNFHPMLWDDSQHIWVSTWLTSTSNPSYSNSGEPNAGYVVSLRNASDAGYLATESWSAYDPYVASSYHWTVVNADSTISSADSIPVVYPTATTLAPGASATFTYSLWREYNSSTNGRLGFNFPNIVIGTVQCP